MIGGIWRRIRGRIGGFDGAADEPDRPAAPPRSSAGTSDAGYLSLVEPGTPSASPYVGVEAAPGEEPRPVEQLLERLTMRLVEDESLRGSLTDDEYQPLLDWATRKAEEIARTCRALPPAAAEARFKQLSGQLLELLRLLDLAIGERQHGSPEVVQGRFQLLDTLLTPPLLPGPQASTAQARLELLLKGPPEELQAADGRTLVHRLTEMLD